MRVEDKDMENENPAAITPGSWLILCVCFSCWLYWCIQDETTRNFSIALVAGFVMFLFENLTLEFWIQAVCLFTLYCLLLKIGCVVYNYRNETNVDFFELLIERKATLSDLVVKEKIDS